MKEMLKILVIAALVVGIGWMVWNGKLGTDVRYSIPLTGMVERTFKPDPETDAENQAGIKTALDDSRKRIKAGSGKSVDRLTVELCETLLGVYRDRAAFEAKMAAGPSQKRESFSGGPATGGGKRNYTSLGGGNQPGGAGTAMQDAARRQYEANVMAARNRSNQLLEQIKQAK